MSEFKAQLLGLIIVLGLFVTVNMISQDVFDTTWTKIENVNSQKISEVAGTSNGG